MRYVLRFVQRYAPEQRAAFMDLEAKFAALEKRRTDFARGKRSQPYMGREPSNTLIWECEFPSLSEAQAALAKLAGDSEHEALFRQQAPYMRELYTEINEILEM